MHRRQWLTAARALLPGLCLALPVSALALAGRFDGLYGQDPFAYYDYAMGPLRASLIRLSPLPQFFWPPGYPLLVALLSLVTGITPLAGQLVSLAAGTAVAVFTGLFAGEVWLALGGVAGRRARVALLGGMLAALVGQLWQSSAVVMADTTGLAAAALGGWTLARFGRTGRGRWLLVASAALAYATLTRWIYGLVAAPFAAAGLMLLWASARDRPQGARRWPALAQGAAATAVAALILAPMLLPAALGRLRPAAADQPAPFAGSLDVYRWDPANALRREFETTDGHLAYRLPNGVYYAAAPAHRYFFTPLLALFVGPGAWRVARRRAGWLAILMLGWPAVVYGFHAGAPWQNFRFTLAYLPTLAVLAAVGVETVREWLPGRLDRVVTALALVGLALMAAGGVRLTQSFVTRKAAELQMVRAVEQRLPPRARLLTFGPTLMFQHYSRVETLELYYLAPADLPPLLADGRPVYLLVDESNFETQWRDEPIAATFQALRPGARPVGAYGELTLFEVEACCTPATRLEPVPMRQKWPA